MVGRWLVDSHDVRLVVELVLRWLSSFATDGFGARTTQGLDIVEVSIVPNVDEPTRRETRVVLEVTVTEGLTPNSFDVQCSSSSFTVIYLHWPLATGDRSIDY